MSLFPTLIPANINLWYGLTKEYSTSGLHHDYHDNLYIIIKGEKRITLYSPADIEGMYVAGEVAMIHPNGRICYKGKVTRADGADVNADKALEASQRLKAAAKKLAEAEDKEDRHAEAIYDAEDEIDRALEDILDAECGDDVDEEEGEDDEGDEDEELEGVWEDIDSDEEEELEEGEDNGNTKRKIEKEEVEPVAKRSKPCPSSSSSSSSTEQQQQQQIPKPLPVSFSRVNTRLPDDVLEKEFPKFLAARSRGVTVTVREGEMLFIPAGWFHEVQSLGEQGHMAFNYWFHPPDNYVTDEDGKQHISFSQPYVSDFWKKDFAERNLH
eukprot:scaffold1307_cov166-Ochromonas_danica.AAC.21